MKTIISLAIALLFGVVLGAVGIQALCNSGHCAIRRATTDRTVAVSPTVVSGAGSLTEESTAPVSCTNPACVTAQSTVSVAESPTIGTAVATTQITGLAIIGDSTQDEYRADNPRGGEYGATTFNWVELLGCQRGVNLGRWGYWPEPRRGGYEYNWARSGATSAAMIGSGQHSGVAEQILAGQVSHVIIQIGINDFYDNNVAFAIYDGQLTGALLQQFLDGIVANVDVAVRTVKIAGDGKVILAATQDYLSLGLLPEMQAIFPDTNGRQRLIAAFAYVNQGMSAVAAREQVPFFDFNAALQRELETRYDPADRRFILVGGERIDVSTKGNDPHYALLGDDFAHPGTVLSGLIANLFVEQMNATFDAGLPLFSDDEILHFAGLR
jgi:hypothetical protein